MTLDVSDPEQLKEAVVLLSKQCDAQSAAIHMLAIIVRELVSRTKEGREAWEAATSVRPPDPDNVVYIHGGPTDYGIDINALARRLLADGTWTREPL